MAERIDPKKLGFNVKTAESKKRALEHCYLRRQHERYYDKNTYILVLNSQALSMLDAGVELEFGKAGVSMNSEGEFLLCGQGEKRKLSRSGKSASISVNCYKEAIEARFGTEFSHIYMQPSTVCGGQGVVLTPNGKED